MGEPGRLSERSESILRLIASGHSYAQIVEQHVGWTYLDIFAAADEALSLSTRSDYADRMVAIKNRHPRAYERWTEDEEAELLRLQAEGHSASMIAGHLERQRSAIRSRIARLTTPVPAG